jgi:hypothetical protein
LTFLKLEIVSIINDLKEFGLLLDGQFVEFFLNFIVDSFKNTVAAFMWPVEIVSFAPPWGAIGLGLAFWLFPNYLKKPIEGWLFDREGDSKEDSDPN